MPTVLVKRDELFKQIGQTFTDEEFDDLCFEFGIELDDVTSEKQMAEGEKKNSTTNTNELSTEVLYRIEVAANRYDLLCVEGIALALKIFLKKMTFPIFKPLNKLPEEERQLIVEPSVDLVRPIGLAAILTNMTFTDDSLRGFMDLQDKLHNNICRGRKYVSIGTHDLDTIKGPFYYRAMKPSEFKFVPLNRTQEVDGNGMMQILKEDPKLSKYLYLIEDKEVYPLMMDSNGVILSVPPIINSMHTKMTINTKNVLIDITGLDYTKCVIVLKIIVSMFSKYCSEPFTVEQVKVTTTKNGESKLYPDCEPRKFVSNIEYLKQLSGIPKTVTSDEIVDLLAKMELNSRKLNEKELEVDAPITRSDVLHQCDIAEDLAIAYGYNKIEKLNVNTLCHGKPQPYNKLADLFRNEMAYSGYVEFLNMALLSKKDMFNSLLEENEDEKTAKISYSKTKEFEYVRSSLIPGILKSIEANKAQQLPYKIFELADCVEINDDNEVGAMNKRKLCFAYSNNTSGLEIIQGMVDKLMKKIDLNFNDKNVKTTYCIKPSNNKIFFEDRQAEIFILDGKKIGIYGIVHPKVLKNFGIKTPVSLCEIEIQDIMDLIIKGDLLEGFV
jgi:phenylalanyl-tRNA synthetase beta chain